MGTVAHIIGIALVVIGAAAIAFVTGVLREHYRQILERQRAAFEEAAESTPTTTITLRRSNGFESGMV